MSRDDASSLSVTFFRFRRAFKGVIELLEFVSDMGAGKYITPDVRI